LILKKPFDQLEVIQLANALTQKWLLAKQAAMRMTELRTLVAQRTSELEDTNTRLVEEMARRRKAEDEIRVISLTDGLTGIYNRRAFDEYLQNVWHDASPETAPLSLLLIDIDNFKAYNDRYGHVAGDECLRIVAKQIASSTARAADFLARYGGEEFALVLPDTDAAGARHVGNRVLENVRSAQIGHESSPVAPIVTVSVGCATLSSPDQGDGQFLTQKADESLYRAKRNGKNGLGVEP
jgi:diguanylate cyclase (GGDEF)-like protein